MTDCTYCSGSHYLMDTPALGPCACCTPEALTASEGEAAQLFKAGLARQKVLETTSGEYGEALSTLDALRDHLDAYLEALGLSRVRTLPDDHLQAMVDQLEAWE